MGKKIVDSVANGARLGVQRKDLAALQDPLNLEFVDDLDSPEAHYFLAIHPDDPRADNARLCAEALKQGTRAMDVLSAAAAGYGSEAA